MLALLHHFPDTADDSCTAGAHIVSTFDGSGIRMMDACRLQTGEVPLPTQVKTWYDECEYTRSLSCTTFQAQLTIIVQPESTSFRLSMAVGFA